VTREDVRNFIGRDWARVAAAKDRAWLTAKRDREAGEALRSADQLRQYARHVRPDWPDSAERAEDFQTHRRISKALGDVRVRAR